MEKNWTDIKVKPPFLSYRWFGQDVKTEALTSSMFPLLWFLSGHPRQSSRIWEILKSWSEEKCALRNLKTLEKSLLLSELLRCFFSVFTGRVFGGRRLWPDCLLTLSRPPTLPWKEKIVKEQSKDLNLKVPKFPLAVFSIIWVCVMNHVRLLRWKPQIW